MHTGQGVAGTHPATAKWDRTGQPGTARAPHGLRPPHARRHRLSTFGPAVEWLPGDDKFEPRRSFATKRDLRAEFEVQINADGLPKGGYHRTDAPSVLVSCPGGQVPLGRDPTALTSQPPCSGFRPPRELPPPSPLLLWGPPHVARAPSLAPSLRPLPQ